MISLTAGLLGFALSLSIEIMQIYLPMRASSQSDLYLNAMGAVLGAAIAVWILESYAEATAPETRS